MMAVKPAKQANQSTGWGLNQRERFIETARALECDEDEAAFDEKLKRIASVKPAPKRKVMSGKPPKC
jgi:hypothetical protein